MQLTVWTVKFVNEWRGSVTMLVGFLDQDRLGLAGSIRTPHGNSNLLLLHILIVNTVLNRIF